MIIDFKEIGVSVIPNFKGGEKETAARMFTDDNNKIMLGNPRSYYRASQT